MNMILIMFVLSHNSKYCIVKVPTISRHASHRQSHRHGTSVLYAAFHPTTSVSSVVRDSVV